MKPVVSVIVPTRNRATLLSRALDSVFAQRRLHDLFELDVVVVDDASTDGTADVVQRYPQIRYIMLTQSGGPARARNYGIRSSSGSYVAFLDDDDVWLPHKLELQVPALDQNPGFGAVYSQFSGHFDGVDGIFPSNDEAPSGWIFRELLLGNRCGADSSLLIRRAALDKVGYFDETLKTNCDYDLWLRLAFHFAFLFVPGIVADYTPAAEGLWFSSAAKGTEADDHVRVVEKGLALLPEWNTFAALRREARSCAAVNSASPLLLMGDLRGAWRALLKALTRYPWALRYPGVRRTLNWAITKSIYHWIEPLPTLSRILDRLGRPITGRRVPPESNSDQAPQTDGAREY